MREETSSYANFSTTLTANFSVLVNGSDQISCVSLDTNQTIDILYNRKRTPPPAPPFSHSFSSLRDGEVSLTLTWDKAFTTTHAVQMYCVRSDLCPGEPCVESDTPFSCPGLVAGGEYMFWVTAVNCGDQRGKESQPLVVRPQVPRIPTISSVVATYNETSTAVQLLVLWEPVPEIQIIDQIIAPIWYRVTVESNRSTEDTEVVMVSCNQSEGTCSALFPLLEAADYTVSISAMNIVGGSNTTVYPNEIFSPSSFYYDPVFSFENCITSVLCSSSLDLSDTTRCVVRYGTGPPYTLLSDPVDGPLNSMFQLPLLKPTTTYYFQTSVLINSSLTVQVQQEFTTGEFDLRLLSSHIGLIIAGAILWIIAAILTNINFLLLGRKDKAVTQMPKSSDSWLKKSLFIFLVVITTILIIIAAILWIAVGFQVGLQRNTCDLNWQGVRNGLIISAFVFTVLSLVTSSVILIILILRWIKGSNVPVKEVELEPPQYAALSHGPEKGDECGFENEGLEGHRGLRVTTEEGIAKQVKDEHSKRTEAANSDGDVVYDTTRHGAPPKPIPNPEDPQYSRLQGEEEKKKKGKKEDKKKKENTESPQDTGEYQHPSHGTGQPHPPPIPGSNECGTSGATGNGSDGVYDTTRHGEPPKAIPNPKDPQYSHLQGEKEKKKKDKQEDKKKKEEKTKPQDTGEYQHLSHGTGQPHPPPVPGPEEYGKLETHPQDQQPGNSVGPMSCDTTKHTTSLGDAKPKGGKKDKKKKPPQGTGEYQHLSHATGQPNTSPVPGGNLGTRTQNQQAQTSGTESTGYAELNNGPQT